QGRAFGQVLRDERASGGGKQNLATVSCGGNARRPIHVETYIPIANQLRRSRMQPDAYPQGGVLRPGMHSQRACRLRRGGDRGGGGREDDEEAIALTVYLGPAISGKRPAPQRLGVGLDRGRGRARPP